jgi:hypothetical protein
MRRVRCVSDGRLSRPAIRMADPVRLSWTPDPRTGTAATSDGRRAETHGRCPASRVRRAAVPVRARNPACDVGRCGAPPALHRRHAHFGCRRRYGDVGAIVPRAVARNGDCGNRVVSRARTRVGRGTRNLAWRAVVRSVAASRRALVAMARSGSVNGNEAFQHRLLRVRRYGHRAACFCFPA